MPTFGFSAFLKLVCLNEAPRRTEVRHRIVGRGGSAYDFHRSLRRLCKQIFDSELTLDEALAQAEQITKLSERTSAQNGLRQFATWLATHRSDRLIFAPITYSSPADRFKVTFSPDFSQIVDGRSTAVHVWNTAAPPLDSRLSAMALSLFPAIYATLANPPQDLGILNLRNGRLLTLSSSLMAAEQGVALANRLDLLFETVETEVQNRRVRPDDSNPEIRPALR